jgi:hypothetical protein
MAEATVVAPMVAFAYHLGEQARSRTKSAKLAHTQLVESKIRLQKKIDARLQYLEDYRSEYDTQSGDSAEERAHKAQRILNKEKDKIGDMPEGRLQRWKYDHHAAQKSTEIMNGWYNGMVEQDAEHDRRVKARERRTARNQPADGELMQGLLDSAKKHEKRVKACERRKTRNHPTNSEALQALLNSSRIIHFSCHGSIARLASASFTFRTGGRRGAANNLPFSNPDSMFAAFRRPSFTRRSAIEASDEEEEASSSRYALVLTYQELAEPYRPPYLAISRPRKSHVYYISVSSDEMDSDASL